MDNFNFDNPNLNPRAPSWSPTKRAPWKAGSLGGKSRSQLLRKSWDKNGNPNGRKSGESNLNYSKDGVDSSSRDRGGSQQRFSAETTLEELNELELNSTTPENKQNGKSFANEFDRLLKR